MTIARKDIVLKDEEAVYHCTSRCVRRAFLCGFDKLTGKSFDHRKAWVKDRIQFLLSIFTIEVLTYALMSNHLHLLLRVLLTSLSDEEVARRWLLLYPKRRPIDGKPPDPNETEIGQLVSDKKRIEVLRKRLGNVSWFMKSLSEFIARRANKEDDCKGRFWEGRFKAQLLKDEAAILACSVYVDLNVIRAKLAKTPEESVFTGAFERICSLKAQREMEAFANPPLAVPAELLAARQMDSWLTPVETHGETRGYLPMSTTEYLSLVDWTGRNLHEGKAGTIPNDLEPILTRIGVNPSKWVESANSYGHWFYRLVANSETMVEAAKALGKKWLRGRRAAKKLFLVGSPA